jgi:hypothetical protein
MQSIIIPFKKSGLGRVEFFADVSTADGKALRRVEFKLDSGSDFTTISRDDLRTLGYTPDFLQSCPVHPDGVFAASDGPLIRLRYINNVSVKFGDREIQGCCMFFSLEVNLRNLFGCDILKYFNREVDYDKGEFRLTQRPQAPLLTPGEAPLQIYTLA